MKEAKNLKCYKKSINKHLFLVSVLCSTPFLNKQVSKAQPATNRQEMRFFQTIRFITVPSYCNVRWRPPKFKMYFKNEGCYSIENR